MGITEELEKVNERLDVIEEGKKKKPKRFKLPRTAKLSNKQVRDNYITVLYINDNKEWVFKKAKIEEGTVMVEGSPRIVTAEHSMTYQGKPATIIPSYSSEPLLLKEHYEEAERNEMLSVGRKLLINRMEMGVIKAKKKLSGALIFFGIIALIVIAYLLLS